MNLRLVAFLVCSASLCFKLALQGKPLALSAPVVASSSGLELPKQPLANQQHNISVSTISARARSLTVKVLSGESWGSGILIQRQGSVYTVLTNEHVLEPGKQYSVQTHDGLIYSASAYRAMSFNGNDLALLQFRSLNTVYSIASLGREASLAVGDEVFAAGFPFVTDKSQVTKFKFTSGRVSLLLTDKALDGGYQVGYTNAIEKGMSGGPVFNLRGEVVAINGMHSYPLWGDPYVFKDGSKPCPLMHELMVKSSWAIPIKTFMQLISQAINSPNSDSERALASSLTL